MKTKNDYPMLLKRGDFREITGLSDSLYYKMLRSGELPTVELNGRKYLHRDRLFEMFDKEQVAK